MCCQHGLFVPDMSTHCLSSLAEIALSIVSGLQHAQSCIPDLTSCVNLLDEKVGDCLTPRFRFWLLLNSTPLGHKLLKPSKAALLPPQDC